LSYLKRVSLLKNPRKISSCLAPEENGKEGSTTK